MYITLVCVIMWLFKNSATSINEPLLEKEQNIVIETKSIRKFICITELEEWEDYYIKYFDLVYILKKNTINSKQLYDSLKIGDVYVLTLTTESIITDIKRISSEIYHTQIHKIKTYDKYTTIFTETKLQLQLSRYNGAYCDIYSKLVVNSPVTITTADIDCMCCVLNIQDVRNTIFKFNHTVVGMIQIDIEFPALPNWIELFTTTSAKAGCRLIFEKGTFLFEKGKTYSITSIKIDGPLLFKIISATLV